MNAIHGITVSISITCRNVKKVARFVVSQVHRDRPLQHRPDARAHGAGGLRLDVPDGREDLQHVGRVDRVPGIARLFGPARKCRNSAALRDRRLFRICARERVFEPVTFSCKRLNVEIELLMVERRGRDLDQSNEPIVIIEGKRN